MDDIKRKERELDNMSLEDEKASRELSIAQKRALIRRAKEEYGTNWKKVAGWVGTHLKSEKMHTMYSQGLGDLRDLSDPRARR